jgi:PAS domain-containing protein
MEVRVGSTQGQKTMRSSDSPEQDAAALPPHDRAEFAQLALENLFEVSPDAIFVTDSQGVIRGANPRAAELFGHTQAELVGRPIESLVPERFRGRHPSHRENYNAHPRARQMGCAKMVPSSRSTLCSSRLKLPRGRW